ncbi:MAG TPA: VOC family protein [Pseudonocardia sp.]|nr:VOC family protein [Pseudonocardia sp.]
MTRTTPLVPFHLAIPVDDIEAAREFYGTVLGFARGRSDTRWTDWNFRGHQLVTHQVGDGTATRRDGVAGTNPVDGHQVPVPHFGLVLSVPEFKELAARLEQAGTDFVIEPYVRFEGEPGEQWTMFFLDPAGNALEFKAFADLEQLFAV